MKGARILAIDQGTTSSRALVVDEFANVLGAGQVAFPQYYPQPGRVEHEPDEIWSSTYEAIATALASASVGTSGADGDRDHESARNPRGLGPGEW